MIELKDDQLVFSFPDVHEHAILKIDFQRTLRIPDDGKNYPLPPGLGRFCLRHVDDFSKTAPQDWLKHGGVMVPMYQSEALWIYFNSPFIRDRLAGYPFAIKIAAGKINAISGKPWADGLNRKPQDYAVAPGQPWLDGYYVKKGVIRQFVAMPLGAGYTAEEQLTGQAEHGGLQIMAFPMKREVFEQRFPIRLYEEPVIKTYSGSVLNCARGRMRSTSMGLAPGGLMKQEIYQDRFSPEDWDVSQRGRCFVHIANSLIWQEITGTNPPAPPLTAAQYTKAGLPWFDYYADNLPALDGSPDLQGLKSIVEVGAAKGDVPLPENQSVDPRRVVQLGSKLTADQVREGAF